MLLCDVAIWSDTASLCFSEVKIGFVPALVGAILAWLVLSVLWSIERKLKSTHRHQHEGRSSDLPTRDTDDD